MLKPWQIAIMTAGLVLVACAVCAWIFWPSPPPPAGSAVELPPSTRVETVEKIRIVPKYITVYKERAKTEIGLPESVQKDPAKHVTATGKLNAEERPYTLAAVLNVETGESSVYALPEELPWLAIDRKTEVGILYGLKNGALAARLEARQNLIAIKNARAGLAATLDQDGDWYIGGGVWLRW